jgi:hypothetical protein
MTRAELHSVQGFHTPSLIAAAQHLRTTMNRKRGGTDPTAIINNEGRMNGYLDCIDDLLAAATPLPPEGQKKSYQPYAPPQGPQTENQNKP